MISYNPIEMHQKFSRYLAHVAARKFFDIGKRPNLRSSLVGTFSVQSIRMFANDMYHHALEI